jgi:hypothetical protein
MESWLISGGVELEELHDLGVGLLRNRNHRSVVTPLVLPIAILQRDMGLIARLAKVDTREALLTPVEDASDSRLAAGTLHRKLRGTVEGFDEFVGVSDSLKDALQLA